MAAPAHSAGRSARPGLPARVIAMLSVMVPLVILSQFFRSSIGVIAPELMAELRLDLDQIATLSSSFFIVFAALQIPLGVFLDRYGVRAVLTTMMGATVVGALVFARAAGFGELVVARLLIGFGTAGLMVGSLVILGRWSPRERFAGLMALVFASANAGSVGATFPLALASETFGWRATFTGLAVLSAVLAALFFAVVRDAPADREGHTRRPASLAEVAKGLGGVFRARDIGFVLPLIATGYASAITVLGVWGGPFLHDLYGLDAVARGNVLSLAAVAMILGTLAYGWLDRRVTSRRRLVTHGAGATVALLGALAVRPEGGLWLAAGLLAASSFVGAYSVIVMAHGLTLFRDELAGRGTTTLNTALMGGAALLQVATGALMGVFSDGASVRGYMAVLASIALITLVALAIYRRAADSVPASGPQAGRSSAPAGRSA